LVLDALRKDVAEEEMPMFNELSTSNISFEKAIAPSYWSLPSHASMFTGQYPHDHQINTDGTGFEDVPLIQSLNKSGYRTYGVSSNTFVSQHYGFSTDFDEFHYTLSRLFSEALNVYDPEFKPDSNGKFSPLKRLANVTLAATKDNYPIKSYWNILVSGLKKSPISLADVDFVDHPYLDPNPLYSHIPRKRNTNLIHSILKRESTSNSPFFIFSNYNCMHHPYFPPKELRERELEFNHTYKDVKKYNQLAHPAAFLQEFRDSEPSEKFLSAIQTLYRGEAVSLNNHLTSLIECLEEFGLRNNTLLIITSDHGENLGEIDYRGERRVGHFESVSDHLLNVPFLVIHPQLSQEQINKTASLKNIFKLVQRVASNSTLTNDFISENIVVEDEVGISEHPARMTPIFDQYPNVHPDIINRRAFQHQCVGYYNDLKLVLSTDEPPELFRDGRKVSIENCPDQLMSRCRESLTKLKEAHPLNDAEQCEKLPDQTQTQLEHLGYL